MLLGCEEKVMVRWSLGVETVLGGGHRELEVGMTCRWLPIKGDEGARLGESCHHLLTSFLL